MKSPRPRALNLPTYCAHLGTKIMQYDKLGFLLAPYLLILKTLVRLREGQPMRALYDGRIHK